MKIDDVQQLKAQIASIENISDRSLSVVADSPQKRTENSGAKQTQLTSAYKKLLTLLSVKDFTEKQAFEKLLKLGYASEEVQVAVERCLANGYIDDVRYAQHYVYAKYQQGQAERRITQKLTELGIDESVVHEIYENIVAENDISEADRAMQFLMLHPVHAKNLRDSAFRKLISKGYSVGVASEVAREYARSLQK